MIAESGDKTALEIVRLAQKAGIPVTKTAKKELDRLSAGGIHQGVAIKAEGYKFIVADELIARAAAKENSIILLLDGITDPQNLGSVIRSAEVFGADGLVIPKAGTATVTAAVWKASAGAVEYIPLAQANLAEVSRRLKDNGFWLVGAESKTDLEITGFDWPKKTALAIGSEGRGLSRIVTDACDYLVKIPMFGKIASLNAGVSAGILLYDYRRRRGE